LKIGEVFPIVSDVLDVRVRVGVDLTYM
jgi:hypothetical protein